MFLETHQITFQITFLLQGVAERIKHIRLENLEPEVSILVHDLCSFIMVCSFIITHVLICGSRYETLPTWGSSSNSLSEYEIHVSWPSKTPTHQPKNWILINNRWLTSTTLDLWTSSSGLPSSIKIRLVILYTNPKWLSWPPFSLTKNYYSGA